MEEIRAVLAKLLDEDDLTDILDSFNALLEAEYRLGEQDGWREGYHEALQEYNIQE
jgi:hypothetical protein